MISTPSDIYTDLRFAAADADDPLVREGILEITRTAFLIDPETGQRIDGDTPKELPMVEAMFSRGAAAHLHAALLGRDTVAYIIYTEGSVTENPGVRVMGLTIMGVHPKLHRQGIGSRLLGWSVARMEGTCDALFVLGHPGFYPRVGFVTASSLGLSFGIKAPSEACMVMPLSGARLLPGVIEYHPIVGEFFP